MFHRNAFDPELRIHYNYFLRHILVRNGNDFHQSSYSCQLHNCKSFSKQKNPHQNKNWYDFHMSYSNFCKALQLFHYQYQQLELVFAFKNPCTRWHKSIKVLYYFRIMELFPSMSDTFFEEPYHEQIFSLRIMH